MSKSFSDDRPEDGQKVWVQVDVVEPDNVDDAIAKLITAKAFVKAGYTEDAINHINEVIKTLGEIEQCIKK